MHRSALRTLLRNLAAAAVPLATGCNQDGLPPPQQCAPPVVADMAHPGPLADGFYPCGTSEYYVLTEAADLGWSPYGEACRAACGRPVTQCSPLEAACGKMVLLCIPGACTGRRPEGLAAAPPSVGEGDAVGAYWAQVAWLEAAAVTAFRVLAAELGAHGAPKSLARRAEHAASDEVRHARMTGALARRAGALVPPVQVEPRAIRPLEAMALENAVEGCVRETFGALQGLVQARRASDRRARRTMASLAADEVRHAELAWAVQRWAAPRLTPAARGRVEQARAAAFASLHDEAGRPFPPALQEQLGLPAPAVARELVRALAGALA